MVKASKGRKQATGRFETREELIDKILFLNREGLANTAIAKNCGVSSPTVAAIVEKHGSDTPPKPPEFPPLSFDQMYALDSFKQAHGDKWRERLRRSWMVGTYKGITADEMAHLQRLRNTHGPKWLKEQ